jgi:hypothetical protein
MACTEVDDFMLRGRPIRLLRVAGQRRIDRRDHPYWPSWSGGGWAETGQLVRRSRKADHLVFAEPVKAGCALARWA